MCRNYNVCILPVIVAVILGIIVGALFFAGIIIAETIAIPVAVGLIFATITYILLFTLAAFGKRETKECLCDYGRCMSIGVFTVEVTGFLALTFLDALVSGGIISAVLIGIFGFGLVLNFLSFSGLLVCLIRKNCGRSGINNICHKFENDYIE